MLGIAWQNRRSEVDFLLLGEIEVGSRIFKP
jgi:hypothetical protein